jgi:hypothetical protein
MCNSRTRRATQPFLLQLVVPFYRRCKMFRHTTAGFPWSGEMTADIRPVIGVRREPLEQLGISMLQDPIAAFLRPRWPTRPPP